jgi:hypothetical protein
MSHRPMTYTSSLKIAAAYWTVPLTPQAFACFTGKLLPCITAIFLLFKFCLDIFIVDFSFYENLSWLVGAEHINTVEKSYSNGGHMLYTTGSSEIDAQKCNIKI